MIREQNHGGLLRFEMDDFTTILFAYRYVHQIHNLWLEYKGLQHWYLKSYSGK